MPSPSDFKGVAALTVIFGLLFALVYFGADMASYGAQQRWKIAFEFEAGLPFIPAFALVYLSIIPLLLLAPLVFRSPRDLLPLFCTLSIVVITAGICFILIPIEKSFPPRQAEGFFRFFFNLADTINLSFNDLPSLHVALSLTTCVALAQRCHATGKLLFAAWALLIMASTIFIHEHHLLDIGGGILLAVLALVFVYRPLNRDDARDRLEIEWICLSECAAFTRRHRRYLLIALMIYQRSLFRWKKTRVLRTGFVLLQVVDDFLDGDRETSENPSLIAEGIARQFETGSFGTDRLDRLAAALWQDMDRCHDPEEARSVVPALIRHMMIDRVRVSEKLFYTDNQLRAHHRNTFRYSMNLLLNAAGSAVRVDSFTELLDAFGWCSTMRDLQEDLDNGLINIPREVVQKAGAEVVDPLKFSHLAEMQPMRRWWRQELERAWGNLAVAQRKAEQIEDASARRVILIFVRSMIGYAKRFAREHSLPVMKEI